MSTLIGWIGSICFALCGIPLALQCIQQGHARGLSPYFLILWTVGEICYIVAVLNQFGFIGWLMLNYLLNLLCILIIWVYYFRPSVK